jgi:hypothetical protein
VVPEDAGLANSVREADSVLLGKRTPHESDTVGSMVMQVQAYDSPLARPALPAGLCKGRLIRWQDDLEAN